MGNFAIVPLLHVVFILSRKPVQNEFHFQVITNYLPHVWKNAYFTGQDVSKSWEGIIKSLVVNGFVQVFYEDIPHSRFPDRWITLGPHYSAWTSFDRIKVHGIKSSLRWKRRETVLWECSYIMTKHRIVWVSFSSVTKVRIAVRGTNCSAIIIVSCIVSKNL